MRLSDLNPRWVGAGGEGVWDKDGNPVPERHGVGVSFDCPCVSCTAQRTGDLDRYFHLRVYVGFRNALDGGTPHDPREGAQWERTGDTFDTLTLRPSILSMKEKGGCGWHGFVTNGDVTSC